VHALTLISPTWLFLLKTSFAMTSTKRPRKPTCVNFIGLQLQHHLGGGSSYSSGSRNSERRCNARRRL